MDRRFLMLGIGPQGREHLQVSIGLLRDQPQPWGRDAGSQRPRPGTSSVACTSCSLDPEGTLELSWNVSYAQETVYFQLLVRELKAGVLFGMSDRGELENADLVVLWTDRDGAYFGVSPPRPQRPRSCPSLHSPSRTWQRKSPSRLSGPLYLSIPVSQAWASQMPT